MLNFILGYELKEFLSKNFLSIVIHCFPYKVSLNTLNNKQILARIILYSSRNTYMLSVQTKQEALKKF